MFPLSHQAKSLQNIRKGQPYIIHIQFQRGREISHTLRKFTDTYYYYYYYYYYYFFLSLAVNELCLLYYTVS